MVLLYDSISMIKVDALLFTKRLAILGTHQNNYYLPIFGVNCFTKISPSKILYCTVSNSIAHTMICIVTIKPYVYTVGVKKGNVLLLHYKILQHFVHELQCVLRETTNRTTGNYRSYYTKIQIILHKTIDRTTQNYRFYYTKLQIVLQILR